ncbi:MAG: 1,4-dihydroxy-2-naphthoate octaprenyltransferase [Crocinitomicaceae bacterium]|nr:1,4-dihydroxy-2-naphthoate octaprenyltransferase [Crocinitomicaceae bacterium]MBT6513887.1 1,4-dihydroxy-2-naphthoate octaprenyltransferase [Crocinitomicaceae bacterium]
MNKVKPWINAIRLRTLPLALSCILIGAGIALNKSVFDWSVLILTVITTVLLQILSNLANDLGDGLKGTDNENRIGPTRAIQSGKITIRAMKIAVILCTFLTLISGLTLLFIALDTGWKFFALLSIGILAIAASIKYTIGKNAFGYHGFGDLFVFVFFGLVGVLGTIYLQSKAIDWLDFLPAIAVGMLCAGVLNLNNMRDFKNDTASNKRTLVVILGLSTARVYHLIITLLPIFLFTFYLIKVQSGYDALLLLIPFVLLLSAIKRVYHISKEEDLDPELKKLALTTFLTAILFTFSLAIEI